MSGSDSGTDDELRGFREPSQSDELNILISV